MPASDAGFKIAARVSGAGLTRMAGIAFQSLVPIGDTLQTTTERLADRAFRAQQGTERFVVYMEAYTRWVESAVWSVLAKSGLLSERERLPTRSLIFVLTERGYKSQRGRFRLEVGGDPTQSIWFKEVCLWQEKPQDWWEHHPGLMTLYPLCNHGLETAQAIAKAATAIKGKSLDHYLRADLLTTLGFFGKLLDRSLNVVSLIGRELMKDSPFYFELMEEGVVKAKREDILQIIKLRFGDEAGKEFREVVERLDNLEQLEELLKLAVTSRRISQFRKALPKE